jgi:hypothetical protein
MGAGILKSLEEAEDHEELGREKNLNEALQHGGRSASTGCCHVYIRIYLATVTDNRRPYCSRIACCCTFVRQSLQLACVPVILKQMTKETKLRILNITAKVALKFDSEAWMLKKRDAAQMTFLRHLLGITELGRERNQSLREKLGVQSIVLEIKQ